jgi:hypothetical protein
MSTPNAMKTSSRTALFLTFSPNLKAVTVVPSSNHGCVLTTQKIFCDFLVPSGKFALKYAKTFRPISFPIRYSFIMLSFKVISPELLTALIRKLLIFLQITTKEEMLNNFVTKGKTGNTQL